jgi:hypothetical protein
LKLTRGPEGKNHAFTRVGLRHKILDLSLALLEILRKVDRRIDTVFEGHTTLVDVGCF